MFLLLGFLRERQPSFRPMSGVPVHSERKLSTNPQFCRAVFNKIGHKRI